MINISHSSVFQQVCIFLDGFPSTREQMDDRQQTMNNGLDNGREYEQDCVAGTRMGAGLQLDNVTITVWVCVTPTRRVSKCWQNEEYYT